MAKKRRMSAKQRLYFGGKTKRKSVRHSAAKTHSTKRKSSSKNLLNGFLPMDTNQHILAFSAGAITAPINDLMKPIQTKYLGWAGQYSDELALMLAGALGHKFGGKVSPMVKNVGKELYRVGVISLGQQTGSGLVQGLFDKVKGVTGQQQTSNGAVIIG